MAYLYGGHSPNYSQPILPPSPYISPYGTPNGGNPDAALPGGSPHSPNAHLPKTFEYSPWQRSTVLPNEHAVDGPPSWARPADSPYKDPFYSPVGGYYNSRQRSNSRNYGQDGYPHTSHYGHTKLGTQSANPSPYALSGLLKTYHVHPLLDETIQNSTLTFNLASPTYSPVISIGPGNWSRIPNHELRQPATWPPVHRLRIICDSLPQWPIDIEPDPSYYSGGYPPNIPPIQVGDVLWKIWHSMRTAIAQLDWASLPADKQEAVSKTFHKRYRPYGSSEREKGVLRIDYTLGKVWFKGLTRVGEGLDVLKIHVV